MNDRKLIGLELELILTDRGGNVVNRADEILHYDPNFGTVVREGTYGVVEINSSPGSSLLELESLFKIELIKLSNIVKSLELKATPFSEVGPPGALKKREGLRYAFQLVLGKLNDALYDCACGTHIHIDREKDIVDQYNLLQSLDPVFVLLSSSSFMGGRNSVNCSRVGIYRNNVFRDLPLHGQLLDYILSLDQLENQNGRRLKLWKDLIGGSEEASEIFNRYNTCWGPIRLNERGTVEVRNADANLFSLVMAMAALYKGVNDYAFSKGLEIRIGSQEQGYGITDSEIILPPYQVLKQMERQGIRYGLKSELVYLYLSYLVGIAEEGLPYSERGYLIPFKLMLCSRRNMADVINDYAHHVDPSINGTIGSATAQKVNKFMAELYLDDLLGGQRALKLIQEGYIDQNPKNGGRLVFIN